MAYGTVKSNTPTESPTLEGRSPVASPDHVPTQTSHSARAEEDESQHGTVWGRVKSFYAKNLGLFFVFLAQIFGSIMSMTTRLLETGFEVKFHALQIIFVRMLATAVIGSLWMSYKNIPDFPLGQKGVRRLLLIRGIAGSTGLFGLYYSLSFLEIWEATVITFLVPTLTAFVTWIAANESFTIREASAGLIAFTGVLFIARPDILFPDHEKGKADPRPDSAVHNFSTINTSSQGLVPPVHATPAERSIAVAYAILGAFAAATAYATIRVIGKRAHSLVSVNYFAVLATVSSFLIIMIHPHLQFEIPQSPAQWCLLLSIGISGFLLQVLLTEGLQREKAGRATNLIYTQLIFSLIIERVVWGTVPTPSSIFGSLLIVASAVWVSMQSKTPEPARGAPAVDEERQPLRSENAERT